MHEIKSNDKVVSRAATWHGLEDLQEDLHSKPLADARELALTAANL